MDLTRMTLYSFKLPNSNNVVFYVPFRFQKSTETVKNYKNLMFLFQNFFKNYYMIMSYLKKIETLTDSEKELKFNVMEFKELVMDFRRKYVVASWREKDSERLHNEMTFDVSILSQKHKAIGTLLKQVKASRK
jgi:hypothetical protein